MNATPALALTAALLLAAGSAFAHPAASDAPTALPAVDATLQGSTCAALSRPSQAQVAAWSGQSNQGQSPVIGKDKANRAPHDCKGAPPCSQPDQGQQGDSGNGAHRKVRSVNPHHPS